MIDKEKYFEEHIPYNLGILLAHYKNTKKPWTQDQNILRAMLVGSLVKGRLFLEVLGITYSETEGKLVPKLKGKLDNIYSTDLGGDMIIIDTLDNATKELLYKYLYITNKAEAHFTTDRPYDNSVIHPAILKIASLVKIYIYKDRKFPLELPNNE